MKKIITLLGLASCGVFFAQTGNVGINTSVPQKTLHINGSVQLTNEFNVGGTASTAGSAGSAGQFLQSNGPGVAPSWTSYTGSGTLILVNGTPTVAQEITVQMTANYTTTSTSTPQAIGNLNNEIIDNQNRYVGTAATNSFTVGANGTYQVTINAQLSTTQFDNPVVGIWDNTTNAWVARVNDQFMADTGDLQTYTLITSIAMLASHTYSFRVTNTSFVTVRAFSSGTTGSGPVTQVTLRRLN
ncbi:hypothetical protein HNP38_003191 [Chryseobacterium defluvii]|uniref:Uncharacterized protein n=1 Tax=Chryseobacterium defluvii TaxID=160396 RepID=A0A840KGS0_9FLAO|nr:hypothetical protein [Chryseobacterium defluvii]MBB4807875.1 hypothetical protein [Chryseobacterium defluvii]